MIQSPLARDRYSSSPVDSPTYPPFDDLDTSRSYADQFNTKHYIHNPYNPTYPSSAPPSPQLTHSSLSRGSSSLSTPASSVSLNIKDQSDDFSDEETGFPAFEPSKKEGKYIPQPQNLEEEERSQTPTQAENLELPSKVNDDQAIEREPSRHVDYLSHQWQEEDIWSSWRYIVHRRKDINNSTRLENASWRTWTKAKDNLKTVSPESLNWLKDCDVTWLYGPLQTGPKHLFTSSTTPPPSRLSHSSSFISKKPILKKRSASAAILERSRSQQSLLQRVGDIIRVQQSSPALGRPDFRRLTSDFTLPSRSNSSVANTPAEYDDSGVTPNRTSFVFPESRTPIECKHVFFNEEVRQVQAVESDDDEKAEAEEVIDESDEDDDGGLMMAPARSRNSKTNTPRGSFGNDGKTIMPLPPTTLKNRRETPEPDPKVQQPGLWPRGRLLSPSASQETLRPSRPNHNFLIDDEPEFSDDAWPTYGNESSKDLVPAPGMRRTESGMFMPYDPEEEGTGHNSLFGSALNAAYTLKDIAHVIWNVGWARDKPGSPTNSSRSGSPNRQ